MDSSTYRFSTQEIRKIFLKSAGITAAIMLLFYRSFWAGLLFPVVLLVQLWQAKKQGIDAKRTELLQEFVSGVGVLNSALQAGLSMENSWKEVEKETRLLYGEASMFYQALQEINQLTAHNVPIEKLFLEFAYKCKVEEMIQFAELLEYGKRSGGNWKKIIDVFVGRMTERYEAAQEIELMVAEKKMEQQIMNIMPLGVLAFLQFSAWDYMSVLYHNWFGCISMSLFLIAYVAAIGLSQKILKVQV